MSKERNRKRLILIILGLMLAFLLLSLGAFLIYNSTKPNPDKAFRNYIEWGLQQNQFAFEQKADGTGTEVIGTVKNNISKKELKGLQTAKCEGSNARVEGNNKISLNASVVSIGANIYAKINSIDGLVNINGTNKQVSTVFQNVKGKWYEVEKDNKGLASQLENNVAMYDTIVLAPDYNTKELADYIINNKVFSFTDFKRNDDKYTFNFVSDKNAYENFLKDNFPNLKNQDIILGNIFGEKSQIMSDFTINKDGQFVSQVLQAQNLCPTLMKTFIGDDIGGFSTELRNDVRYLEYSTVSDTTVESSQPINKLFSELTF